MSRNNLELRKGNDIVWLNYWDFMHGKDRVIEIRDGKAYLSEWKFKDENDKDGEKIFTEVNLVEFLVELSEEVG